MDSLPSHPGPDDAALWRWIASDDRSALPPADAAGRYPTADEISARSLALTEVLNLCTRHPDLTTSALNRIRDGYWDIFRAERAGDEAHAAYLRTQLAAHLPDGEPVRSRPREPTGAAPTTGSRPRSTEARNGEMYQKFRDGATRRQLAKEYCLSYDTVKGIIRTERSTTDG